MWAIARITGYALNVAIGLQVVISALITGLSAVTTGRNVSRFFLGGMCLVCLICVYVVPDGYNDLHSW